MIVNREAVTMMLTLTVATMMLSLTEGFMTQQPAAMAFVSHKHRDQRSVRGDSVTLLNMNNDNEDAPDNSGANLMAEFSRMAQSKGMELSEYELQDLDEDDEEDESGTAGGSTDDDGDDDDDDEPEPNIPQGAINAFLGYDTGDVGEKLAGNVELTDRQLYSEVKERVLDTAGGFVDFVGKNDDDDHDDEDDGSQQPPKPYQAPETVPDSELTAGEVCTVVLEAIRNNDTPSPNRGVEILFGYSSQGSYIIQEQPNGLTPKEYTDYLKETEYKVLFTHEGITIDKGKYSHDGKKCFFNASLRSGMGPKDWTSVNFILSSEGEGDNTCWMIDSLLIRPQSMQRRRRR